jgi:RNA polymerase sigma factor (sigma-70 family)
VKTSAPPRFTRPFAAGNRPAASANTLAAGHVERFRQVVLPHLDGAYNLARYLTRDAVLSEDLVQDAVLRAFRAFGQFRGGSPRAWLFAIVRNCCRTAMSGNGGMVSLVVHESALGEDAAAQLGEHPDPAPTPEEEVFRKADVNRVRAAVEAIPEPFREAVVLRDLEDLSYAEIAEVTGVPVGTVMSRLSRGRAMLAKELLPARSGGDDQTRSVK